MKNIYLILALVLTFVLVSCGEKKPEAEPQDMDQTETPATQAETAPPMDVEEEATAPEEVVTDDVAIKTDAAPAKTAVTKGEWTGYVVHFADAVKGKNKAISKEKAAKLASKGHVLAFMTGKDFYLVFNTDGSFASKKLLAYAGTKDLKISGKIKTFQGMKYIIADKYN
jgi:hypothetical protein